MNVIELEEMVPMSRVEVFVPVDMVGVAYTYIEAAGGRDPRQGEFDDARGGFPMSSDVVEDERGAALDRLRDASRGRIS